MIVNVKAEKFRNIRNPYTGETMEVKMVTGDGVPLFFAPGQYSTAKHFATAREAIDAWDRTDGVTGLKARDSLRCAYTGEPLTVEEDSAGFYLAGGFDPCAMHTDDEFLLYATMRDGVSASGRTETTRGRVTAPSEVADIPPEARETYVEPSDDARHAAESVVSQFKDAIGLRKERTQVSMSRGRRK